MGTPRVKHAAAWRREGRRQLTCQYISKPPRLNIRICNGDGIQQAITGATSNPSANLAVTVTQFCECPDGTSVDCSGTCAAGVSPDTFVRVNLAQPARTYLSETGLLSGHTLTAGATMRVK